MESSIIKTELKIAPEHFSKDRMFDHILQRLREDHEQTCSRDHGYIDHIRQVMDITHGKLMDSGECIVHVKYDAMCFNPIVGKRVTTTVEMVIPHGIFSSLCVLRFLIPFKTLAHSYDHIHLDNDESAYRHRTSKHIIQRGDHILIEITNLKYENNHFSSIAKLIDTDRASL